MPWVVIWTEDEKWRNEEYGWPEPLETLSHSQLVDSFYAQCPMCLWSMAESGIHPHMAQWKTEVQLEETSIFRWPLLQSFFLEGNQWISWSEFPAIGHDPWPSLSRQSAASNLHPMRCKHWPPTWIWWSRRKLTQIFLNRVQSNNIADESGTQ